jgi:hypothetical protein
MTPKEKAQELYNKFYNTSSHQHHVESRKDNAKQCALIAVDEILKVSTFFKLITETEYWNEVKKEIEAL